MGLVCQIIIPAVARIVDLDLLVNTNEYICNCHFIHGQCAGLIRANIVSTSHDLAGGQLFNEVLINEHSADGVGKGDHDCERETFGHGYNNNSYCNQKVSEPLDKVDLKVVLV
jgi:hypothetical protein